MKKNNYLKLVILISIVCFVKGFNEAGSLCNIHNFIAKLHAVCSGRWNGFSSDELFVSRDLCCMYGCHDYRLRFLC